MLGCEIVLGEVGRTMGMSVWVTAMGGSPMAVGSVDCTTEQNISHMTRQAQMTVKVLQAHTCNSLDTNQTIQNVLQWNPALGTPLKCGHPR